MCAYVVRSGACNDEDDEARDETEGREPAALCAAAAALSLSSSIVRSSVGQSPPHMARTVRDNKKG